MVLILKTAQETLKDIATRFKERRLELNLTQSELATRSGVSLGSLKRFESSGLIALDSLLKLAVVLRCLGDFDRLAAPPDIPAGKTFDQLMAEPGKRRRASGGGGRRK